MVRRSRPNLASILAGGVIGLVTALLPQTADAEEFFRQKYNLDVNGTPRTVEVSADLTGNQLTVEAVQRTLEQDFQGLSEAEARRRFSRLIANENSGEMSSATNVSVVHSPSASVTLGPQTMGLLPEMKAVPAIPHEENLYDQAKMKLGMEVIKAVVKKVGVHPIIQDLVKKGAKELQTREAETARRNLEKLTSIADAEITTLTNYTYEGFRIPTIFSRTWTATVDQPEGTVDPYLAMKVSLRTSEGDISTEPIVVQMPYAEQAESIIPYGQVVDWSITPEMREKYQIKDPEGRMVVVALNDFETGGRKFLTQAEWEQAMREQKISEKETQKYDFLIFSYPHNLQMEEIRDRWGAGVEFPVSPECSFEEVNQVPSYILGGLAPQRRNPDISIIKNQGQYYLVDFEGDPPFRLRSKRLRPTQED